MSTDVRHKHNMKKQYLIIIAILAIAVIAMGVAYTRQQNAATTIADESSVRLQTTQFGSSIQKVSLSAPDALNQMVSAYAPYASSSLLASWQNNKSFAPGKGLSSPWPDRIEIQSVTKQSNGTYVVEGNVIEVTSQEVTHGGIAAQFPVTITFTKYPSGWLMTDYKPGPIKTFINASTTTQ
jgi:nitrate/nitrite-specific signal transduction histidine kinase